MYRNFRFKKGITRTSNIEIQSLFSYLRSCNVSSIFKNRYRSCTWYISVNSPEIQLRFSLSLFLFPCLSWRTRIETMAKKRYRGTGASWQGRTTTSRMLLYVGNTSFILRSISVSTLERKPPCPLFSLPPSLSLVSSCWTVCPHDRSISRVTPRVILGLVASSFDETTYVEEKVEREV